MLKNSEDAYQFEKAINKLSHISKMEDRLAVFQYQEPPNDQNCEISQENFEWLQDQINTKLRAKARHTQAQASHALKDQALRAARAHHQASHAHVGSFSQLQDSDQGTDSDDSESNHPDIIEADPAVDLRVQNPDLRDQNPDFRAQNPKLRAQNPNLEFDKDSKVNDKAKNCELLMVTHGNSKPKIRFYTNIFAKDKMGIPKSDISRIFTTGDSSDSEEGLSDSDDEQEFNSEVSGINYPVNSVAIELTNDLKIENLDLEGQNPDLGNQNPDLGDQNPDLPDVKTNDDHETFGGAGVDETNKKLFDLYKQALMLGRMRIQNPAVEDQNPDIEDQNSDVEDQNPDLPDLVSNDDHETFGCVGEDVTNNDEFDPYHQSQMFERMRGQNSDQCLDLPDLDGNAETNDDHETFGNANENETNGEFDPFHQSQLFEVQRQNPDFRDQNPDLIQSQLLEIERQLPDDLYFIQDSENNDDLELPDLE